MDILRSDDQGRPRVLQDLAQPVAWIVRINCYKGPSRRQASQNGEGEHRTGRQHDADQFARFGFGLDVFSQSGKAIPHCAIRKTPIRIGNRDTVWISPRHSLEVSDDRPVQIFVAKLGENPIRWAIPVQGALTVIQPLHIHVALNCHWTQLSTLPRLTA